MKKRTRAKLLPILSVIGTIACNSSVPSSGPSGGDSPGPTGGDSGCVFQGNEICDGIDNNCDGNIDEGVLNACGNCSTFCNITNSDPVSEGTAGDAVEGIDATDPDNPTGKPGITLVQGETTVTHYLWPANTNHDSVTKFDTDTLTEEGRYWVGDNPSRTAVDLDGNCWVGGRSDGRLTKIIAEKADCIDREIPGVRELNGVIDTSEPDVNGDITTINGPDNPLLDECVAYSEVPNPSRTSIRGLAVAPDGKVWIAYTSGGIQSIDPHTFQVGTFYPGTNVPLWTRNATTGVLEDSGQTTDVGGGYGVVIDSRGRLYLSTYARAQLPCFDTVTERWIAIYKRAAGCSYGIAVDGRNRIWTGSYPQCTGVGMFDPDALKFYTFALPESAVYEPLATANVQLVDGGGSGGKAASSTTGVAVEPGTGDVWTSFFQQGFTGRLLVDENDFANSSWILIGTLMKDDNSGRLTGLANKDLRGVGFDSQGFAWTLGLSSDRIFKIDPNTNLRHADSPQGLSAGIGPHYTYSDFTGSTAFNFTAPRGNWRHIYALECYSPKAIDWEAYVPTATGAGLRVRPLDENGAPAGDWIPNQVQHGKDFFDYPVGAASAHIDLSGEQAGLQGTRYEVDVVMTTSNPDVRPIVHKITLTWNVIDCIDM